jgi:hypothetical protein
MIESKFENSQNILLHISNKNRTILLLFIGTEPFMCAMTQFHDKNRSNRNFIRGCFGYFSTLV